MRKIILASASPRRKQLLENIGLKFEIQVSNFEEKSNAKFEPHKLAKYLSLKKAEAVASKNKNSIIISADTLVVFENEILGKPHTKEGAKKMLNKICGKPHLVITGITIIDTKTNKIISETCDTKVYLKKLTSKEIDNYVNSGESLDKAGGYAVQGLGALIIEKIEGDYFNVVGLPLFTLSETLKKFGISLLS